MRPSWTHAGVALLLVLLLALWAQGWLLLSTFDAQLHDRITRFWGQSVVATDVVVIDIDELSLAELGPWPWPRTVLAKMLLKLRDSGARVQLWDLFLPEPFTGDSAFNAALAAPSQRGKPADVVLGQVLILDPLVQAPPQLGQLRASSQAPTLCSEAPALRGFLGISASLPMAHMGHISATPDQDGGLRRLPAVLCQGPQRFPQLTLAAAELLQAKDSWQQYPGNALLGPAQWLQRGNLRFALDAQGQMLVPYRQAHSQWPAISALHLLDGSIDPSRFSGKVVLLGATAVGLGDTVSTPFHPKAPGISVHAELIAAALSGQWVTAPGQPWLATLLIAALPGLLMLLAARRLQRPLALTALGSALTSVPLLLAVLAQPAGYRLPVTLPTLVLLLLLSTLVALYLEAQRQQSRLLTHHLESFLPHNLALEIARQNPSGESLGKPGKGVVLALRVTGLERWCASVDSFKALGLVHAISSLAEAQARLHAGTLEHVQGDTLLLVWPGQAAAQVQAGVQAAQGLWRELGALLARTESEHRPLGLRMTLDLGEFLQAVAGSKTSRHPLILGAAVDTVLAMLPLCEELASPLLLGQRAAQAAPALTLHPMGQFWLPDAAQALALYRVEP